MHNNMNGERARDDHGRYASSNGVSGSSPPSLSWQTRYGNGGADPKTDYYGAEKAAKSASKAADSHPVKTQHQRGAAVKLHTRAAELHVKAGSMTSHPVHIGVHNSMASHRRARADMYSN